MGSQQRGVRPAILIRPFVLTRSYDSGGPRCTVSARRPSGSTSTPVKIPLKLLRSSVFSWPMSSGPRVPLCDAHRRFRSQAALAFFRDGLSWLWDSEGALEGLGPAGGGTGRRAGGRGIRRPCQGARVRGGRPPSNLDAGAAGRKRGDPLAGLEAGADRGGRRVDLLGHVPVVRWRAGWGSVELKQQKRLASVPALQYLHESGGDGRVDSCARRRGRIDAHVIALDREAGNRI